MLTAYRRHSTGCKLNSMGQRRCACPIWVNGRVRGDVVRKALSTRNWEAGQRIIREWERDGVEAATMTIDEACDRFMDSLRSRNLRPTSIAKFELLVKELKWNLGGALALASNADLQALQSRWNMAPISRSKKLARVKQFFRYCQESGWIQANPAKALKPPIFRRKQVVTFTADQLEKILWATEIYPDVPKGRRAEVRAFVLLMRYTGLRIGDCVAIRRQNINEEKVHLRTAKTGRVCGCHCQKKR